MEDVVCVLQSYQLGCLGEYIPLARPPAHIANEIYVLRSSAPLGKSSISLRLVRSKWTDEYDPTIQDSYSVTRIVDGRTYQLSLTDTAGQEEYVHNLLLTSHTRTNETDTLLALDTAAYGQAQTSTQMGFCWFMTSQTETRF